MPIYTNQSVKKSVRYAVHQHRTGISRLLVATAFFTDAQELLDIAKIGVQINVIVRLGEGTSSGALRKIISKTNINVRYYTSSKFHPKLYIFGNKIALVGSANFTQSGLNSNSEVCITVDGYESEFADLAALFSEYWSSAAVLDAAVLANYEYVLSKKPPVEFDLEKEIKNKLGEVIPPGNIDVTKRRKPKENLFIEDYERYYQVIKSAFDEVEEIYKEFGKRKVPEDKLPLRIEIDQFFNYVRGLFAGEAHLEAPIRPFEDFRSYTRKVVDDWFSSEWSYLDTIVERYQVIRTNFESPEHINALSKQEICETLLICHAFHDQLRFHKGGLEALKTNFLNDNDEGDIKETLIYLLHGNEKFTVRMANCIYGGYKLNHMSTYSIQELLGWVNQENIPICNGRTEKSLRYLGKEIQ